MPGFVLSASAQAPVEEVWKLLFDPSRFPQWWVGVATVRTDSADAYTQWPTGFPDFAMPQLISRDPEGARVTISCQVSDIEFVWRLTEAGTGTGIRVEATLPEAEAHRFADQRRIIAESLQRLATLAEAAT